MGTPHTEDLRDALMEAYRIGAVDGSMDSEVLEESFEFVESLLKNGGMT